MNSAAQNQHPDSNKLEKIMQDYLLTLPETEMSFAEQRDLVTDGIGQELDTIFDRHEQFATQDPDGTKNLTLTVPLSASTARARITSRVDEAGSRTAFMWLEGKVLGRQMFKYTDGPDQKAQLVPYAIDEQTGQRQPRRIYENHDPHSDGEVASWGKVWIKNLRDCEPEPRRPGSLIRRALGRLGMR